MQTSKKWLVTFIWGRDGMGQLPYCTCDVLLGTVSFFVSFFFQLPGDTPPDYDITLSSPLFSVTPDRYISLTTPNLNFESFANPIIPVTVS